MGRKQRSAGLDAAARLGPDALAAWVQASCAAQGVAVKVVDFAVVRQMCALLDDGAAAPWPERQRRRGPPARASQPPMGVHPGGVEAAGARGVGAGVIP